MYVRNRMTANPYCISKDTAISTALDIMAEHGFHRLPVVEGKHLVGLVTEGVISEHSPSKATSLSIHELNYLLSKTKCEDVMIKNVITISPDVLLEEAAVIMRKNKVGCLVVVDNDEVVGIITHNDIFDAFVDLLGYYEAGTRYVIEVTEDKPGILAEVAQCFFDQKAIITNLAVYHYPGIVDIVIRARDAESNAMKQVLTTRGFNVVSVIENK